MEKIHKIPSEAMIFLELAADAMEEYKVEKEEYANEWHMLDISFANGLYRAGDVGTEPKEKMKNHWQPKNCKYIYVIKSANQEAFFIVAINKEGVSEYEMRQNFEYPKKII